MNLSYAICGSMVGAALLIFILTIVLHKKRKKSLDDYERTVQQEMNDLISTSSRQAERTLSEAKEKAENAEKDSQARIEAAEKVSQARIEAAEKASQERIIAAEKELEERIQRTEDELAAEQEALKNEREVFRKEQDLREDISRKTDRDIAVEMHVKEMRILAILSEMNEKMVGAQNFADQLQMASASTIDSVNELKEVVSSSTSDLEASLNQTRIKAVSDLETDMESTTAKVESLTNQVVESMDKMNDTVAMCIGNVQGELKEIVKTSTTEMQEKLGESAEEIKEGIKNSAPDYDNLVEVIKQAATIIVETIIEAVRETGNNTVESLCKDDDSQTLDSDDVESAVRTALNNSLDDYDYKRAFEYDFMRDYSVRSAFKDLLNDELRSDLERIVESAVDSATSSKFYDLDSKIDELRS